MAKPRKKIDAGSTKKKRTVKIANNAKAASFRTEAQKMAVSADLRRNGKPDRNGRNPGRDRLAGMGIHTVRVQGEPGRLFERPGQAVSHLP